MKIHDDGWKIGSYIDRWRVQIAQMSSTRHKTTELPGVGFPVLSGRWQILVLSSVVTFEFASDSRALQLQESWGCRLKAIPYPTLFDYNVSFLLWMSLGFRVLGFAMMRSKLWLTPFFVCSGFETIRSLWHQISCELVFEGGNHSRWRRLLPLLGKMIQSHLYPL